MDGFTAILVIILIILCSLGYLKINKSHLALPGPNGYPFIGYPFILKPRSYMALQRLRKEYGKIFQLQLGQRSCIVLASYSVLKEALITKGDNFSGRIKGKLLEKLTRNKGIIFTDGALWQEHRRFSLQVLRDFGFGRNLSEEVVLTESNRLHSYIDSRIGKSINCLDILQRTISNVIATITLGEQPGYEDVEFGDVIQKFRSNLKRPAFAQMQFKHPWLASIPGIFSSFALKTVIANLETGHQYIIRKINKHKETIDFEGEPRDFTDVYLQKQHQMNQSGETHTFSEWQLIRVISELFIAGTDTTANSISWALIWLAIRPEVQIRMQKEMDNKFGRDGQIAFKDRQELPYAQAFMDEVQRWASIVPNSLLHRNFKEDMIAGFLIPANSAIIPCLYAIMHDPEVWEKPDEFYPEHFLDETGTKYRPRDELVTFSLGKRACLGESLAQREYFIFLTHLVRRYNIRMDPDSEAKLDEVLLGTDGTIRSPGFHQLIFKLR